MLEGETLGGEGGEASRSSRSHGETGPEFIAQVVLRAPGREQRCHHVCTKPLLRAEDFQQLISPTVRKRQVLVPLQMTSDYSECKRLQGRDLARGPSRLVLVVTEVRDGVRAARVGLVIQVSS